MKESKSLPLPVREEKYFSLYLSEILPETPSNKRIIRGKTNEFINVYTQGKMSNSLR